MRCAALRCVLLRRCLFTLTRYVFSCVRVRVRVRVCARQAALGMQPDCVDAYVGLASVLMRKASPCTFHMTILAYSAASTLNPRARTAHFRAG